MAAPELPECSGIELYTDKGDQLVDLVHDQISDNVCLRVSDKHFSVKRRDTPAYSRLLVVSSTYGYMVAGTPGGLSVFTTADAQDQLARGKSMGTNTAVMLSARTEIDLRAHGKVSHVGTSADELRVLVATASGNLLVFDAAALVGRGSGTPVKVIRVGQEIRDMRPNPLDLPMAVAVLTLGGALVIVDIMHGTAKTIVPAGATRITAICWSRKGKQIVCGDTDAKLTQRTPADGAVKKIISPPQSEGAPEGAAVLAVEWMSNASFFAVYGLLPSGAFTPGQGGGGYSDDSGDEDDGSGDEADSEGDDHADPCVTAAYVIAQDSNTAPLDWIYVEDPCSSMMCPERYPGFHTVCIPEWGPSAQQIVIMAGTSSDATMTIGLAATLPAKDGSADPGSLDWAQWDIDGGMAVMPLSALSADGVEDAFPIGMGVDYTGRRDLPPVETDGPRVKPVPILWILNTDGCLLGYHVCNTFEMQRGVRCSHMVDSVKALPGAGPAAAAAAAASAKPAPFASGTAFGGAAALGAKKEAPAASSAALPAAFGGAAKPAGAGAFGASTGFAPSFGGSSASPAFGGSGTITPIVKAPTALGTGGKHVFGGGSGATPFGGFAAAAAAGGKSIFDAAPGGPSIFDAAPGGPSIFDAPAAGAAESPFGAALSLGPKKAAPGFGARAADAGSSGAGDQTVGRTSAFDLPRPAAAVTSSPSPEPTQPFVGLSFGRKLGVAAAKHSFGAQQPAQLDAGSPSTLQAEVDKKRREEDEAAEAQRLEQERQQAEELRKAKEKEAEEQREKERLAAQQREMEARAQELLDQQYVRTCNSVDRELKALAASVVKADETIARMRATRLPPIRVDPTVQSVANLTSQMKDLSIDDTELWNRTADVLLEALHVSRDELRASQRSLAKQLSAHLKSETKCDEATRLLGASASAASPPNSAAGDAALTPLQRDYQQRLKGVFALISKRVVDVEQVVNAEADRLQSERDELPRSLRAPTLDSIQRTLGNVSKTLAQKNNELDDLVDLVNDMNLGTSADQLRKKPRPPPLSCVSVSGAVAAEEEATPVAVRRAAAPRTAASGVPWSPKDMPFGTTATAATPSAKRGGGYGLHGEDLFVSKASASPGADGLSEASPSAGQTATVPLPAHFARTQVRELVPRSIKHHRKASLVVDDPAARDGRDDASVVPSSQFSMAASHLQTRRQRAVARDVLTRATRTVAVFRAPELSTFHAIERAKGGSSALSQPTPMPDLSRYAQAFEKLRYVEPEPEPEPEPPAAPAPAPTQAPLDFGKFLPPKPASDKWTCGTCELLNPASATTCVVCEEPRPGAPPAPSQAVVPAFGSAGGGFQPSGGLSFGAASSADVSRAASASPFGSFSQRPAAAARPFAPFVPPSASAMLGADTPKAASESPFGSLSRKPAAAAQLFPSFVPPGASAAPEETEKPVATGFQPISGFALGAASSADAQKRTIDLSARPAVSFPSFAPPGSAPSAGSAKPEKPAPGGPEWECEVCMLMSPSDATQCIVCEAARPRQAGAAPPPPPAAADVPKQAAVSSGDSGSGSDSGSADDDDVSESDVGSDLDEASESDAGSDLESAVREAVSESDAGSDLDSDDHDEEPESHAGSDLDSGIREAVPESDAGGNSAPAGPEEPPESVAVSDGVVDPEEPSEGAAVTGDVADPAKPTESDADGDRAPVGSEEPSENVAAPEAAADSVELPENIAASEDVAGPEEPPVTTVAADGMAEPAGPSEHVVVADGITEPAVQSESVAISDGAAAREEPSESAAASDGVAGPEELPESAEAADGIAEPAVPPENAAEPEEPSESAAASEDVVGPVGASESVAAADSMAEPGEPSEIDAEGSRAPVGPVEASETVAVPDNVAESEEPSEGVAEGNREPAGPEESPESAAASDNVADPVKPAESEPVGPVEAFESAVAAGVVAEPVEPPEIGAEGSREPVGPAEPSESVAASDNVADPEGPSDSVAGANAASENEHANDDVVGDEVGSTKDREALESAPDAPTDTDAQNAIANPVAEDLEGTEERTAGRDDADGSPDTRAEVDAETLPVVQPSDSSESDRDAHGKSPGSDGHDSDGFVHVSQQLLVSDDGEQDVESVSSPAVIIGSGDASPATPAQTLSSTTAEAPATDAPADSPAEKDSATAQALDMAPVLELLAGISIASVVAAGLGATPTIPAAGDTSKIEEPPAEIQPEEADDVPTVPAIPTTGDANDAEVPSSEAKPEEVIEVKPEEVIEVKPEEASEVKPEEASEVKPEEASEISAAPASDAEAPSNEVQPDETVEVPAAPTNDGSDAEVPSNEVPAALSEAETEEAVEEAQDQAVSEMSDEDVPELGPKEQPEDTDEPSDAVSDELSEAATDELPDVDDVSIANSEAESPNNSPRKSMLQKSRTSSGEFVMLSHPHDSREATPPAASGTGFSMTGLAEGIEAAGDDTGMPATPEPAGLSSDEGRSDASPTKAYSAPRAALGSAPESLAGSSTGAGSFFKAGRLGNFGSTFKPASTSFGASATTGSGLPSALTSQPPPAPLAFGEKLDKPAFGVSSAASFGNRASSTGLTAGSGGFASMSKAQSGFSAHAALPNAFATQAPPAPLPFGASSTSSFGAQPATTAALPPAFTSQAPPAPAFGMRVDKPAFGVSSAASFGNRGSSAGLASGTGGFTSASKAPSGFSAHATLPNALAPQAPPAPLAFGMKVDKPAFGAPSTSLFGAQPASSAALPPAFLSQPPAAPAFGLKASKPAFGVSSAASLGNWGSSTGLAAGVGGFTSASKTASGFGAHAAAAQDSFAAISEKSRAAEAGAFGVGAFGVGAFGGSQGGAGTFASRSGGAGFGQAFGAQIPSGRPAVRPPVPSDDPIRSIIHGDDSDGAANDSGNDSD